MTDLHLFLTERLNELRRVPSAISAFMGTRPDDVMFDDAEPENFLIEFRLASGHAADVDAFERRLWSRAEQIAGLFMETFREEGNLIVWTHAGPDATSELLQKTVEEFGAQEDEAHIRALQPPVLFGFATPHEAMFLLGRLHRLTNPTAQPAVRRHELARAIIAIARERLAYASARSWIYRAGLLALPSRTYETLERDIPGSGEIPDGLMELYEVVELGTIREHPLAERLGIVDQMMQRLYAHRVHRLTARNALRRAPSTPEEREQLVRDLALAYFLEQALNQGQVEAL